MATGVTPSRRRLNLRVVVAWLALVVALGFGAMAIARDAEQLAQVWDRLDWWVLPASTLAVCVGLWCTAMCWRWFVRVLGHAAPLRLVTPFFLTQAGKYVPGAVWPVVAQAEVGRQLGLPRSALPAATAMFMVAHITTGAAVGSLLGLVSGLPLPSWLLLLILAAAVAGMLPWAAQLGAAALVRLLRTRRVPAVLSVLSGGVCARAWWAAHAWMAVTWLPYGLSLWLLLTGFDAQVRLGPALATFALAWVGGFLVLIAPAGVGPRDAIMAALLLPAVSVTGDGLTASSVVLASAVASRLTTTVGDVVMALGSLAVRRAMRRGESAPAG